MNSQRMSFEEASRELNMTEEELEQLVAAGEIATVKEGDTLYFKKDVVSKFKQRKEDSSILLSDEEINLLDDSGVEEIDLLADDDATDETPTPTKPQTPSKSPITSKSPAASKSPITSKSKDADEDDLEISLDADDDIPSLNLDSDDELSGLETTSPPENARKEGSKEEDETLLNLDNLLEDDSEGTTPIHLDGEDTTLLDTEGLDLSDDADPFNTDTSEETGATDLAGTGTLLRSGGARVMQMKRKSGSPAMTVLLALSVLLLLLPLATLTHLVFASSGESKTGAAPKDSFGWITEYNILEGTVEAIADAVVPAK